MTGLSIKGEEPNRFGVVFVEEGDEPLHPLGSYGVIAIYNENVRLLSCRSSQVDAEAIADLLVEGLRATKPDHQVKLNRGKLSRFWHSIKRKGKSK